MGLRHLPQDVYPFTLTRPGHRPPTRHIEGDLEVPARLHRFRSFHGGHDDRLPERHSIDVERHGDLGRGQPPVQPSRLEQRSDQRPDVTQDPAHVDCRARPEVGLGQDPLDGLFDLTEPRPGVLREALELRERLGVREVRAIQDLCDQSELEVDVAQGAPGVVSLRIVQQHERPEISFDEIGSTRHADTECPSLGTRSTHVVGGGLQFILPASMSTAGKLWFGFGLLLALLVGTGLFVAHRLASIERSLVTILAVQEPATAATYEMAINVIGTRAAVLHYVSIGDSADKARIADLDAEFRDFKTRFDPDRSDSHLASARCADRRRVPAVPPARRHAGARERSVARRRGVVRAPLGRHRGAGERGEPIDRRRRPRRVSGVASRP